MIYKYTVFSTNCDTCGKRLAKGNNDTFETKKDLVVFANKQGWFVDIREMTFCPDCCKRLKIK